MNPYAAKEIALGLMALYRADPETAHEHFKQAAFIVRAQADRMTKFPPPAEAQPVPMEDPTLRIILHDPATGRLVLDTGAPTPQDSPFWNGPPADPVHVELPESRPLTPDERRAMDAAAAEGTARLAEKSARRRKGTS